MKLLMEHPNTGIIKNAPVGFSWTTFFFGPIPALTRGDIIGAFVLLILFFIAFGFSVFGMVSGVWGLIVPYYTNGEAQGNRPLPQDVVSSVQGASTVLAIVSLLGAGIIVFVYSFMYNKLHIKKLLKKGFKVKDVEGGTLEDARKKLGINLPQFETQK
jgi:hypothetical protein